MTLCRQNYHEECEAGINKQVNLELYASYVYLSMAYHFDRDDVALPGFHKFMLKQSNEEREHAQKLMKYQNQRGGRIVLQDIKRRAMDEEDWEEEEHLVVVKLEGVIDNEFLYNCDSANCRLLGIDTDEPVLQIGNYTFIGEFKEAIGTHVLFEELESNDDEGSKQLKYRYNTTKTLEMTRVFLVEKEKEQIPGPSHDAQGNQGDAQENQPDAQEHQPDAQEHQSDAQDNQHDAQENQPDAQDNQGDAQENQHDAQEHQEHENMEG